MYRNMPVPSSICIQSLDVTVSAVILVSHCYVILPDPSQPSHGWIVSFSTAGRGGSTIVTMYHTIARAEPDPMTAIQRGEQRLSDSSDMTQMPLMRARQHPATPLPLPVPHKATGSAMTRTRMTNDPLPNSKTQKTNNALQQLDTLKTSFTKQPNDLWMETDRIRLINTLLSGFHLLDLLDPVSCS